jgi:hypothetical protein
MPIITLTSGNVEQIKVVLKHRSALGKSNIDNASLILTPGNPRGVNVLPLPAIPEGFRGGN